MFYEQIVRIQEPYLYYYNSGSNLINRVEARISVNDPLIPGGVVMFKCTIKVLEYGKIILPPFYSHFSFHYQKTIGRSWNVADTISDTKFEAEMDWYKLEVRTGLIRDRTRRVNEAIGLLERDLKNILYRSYGKGYS